jgi:formate hydrogenlyase transcriptional activator
VEAMANSILLEICGDLAPARDMTDVLAVVDNRVKKLIDFSHSVIGVLNPHRNTLDLTGQGGDLQLDDAFMKLLQKAGAPRQFPISDCPKYFSRLSYWPGNGRMTIVTLKKQDGECAGCLVLFHRQSEPLVKTELELLKSIAVHLSIAVDNILIRKEVTRKENEKSLLLSFSNHLATVRDVNGLKFIIKQYLKQLFRISEYIITIRDTDNSTYSYFLHDLAANEPADEGFKRLTGSKIPIAGDITGAVLRSDDPVLFNIKEVLITQKYAFPAASFWRAAGAEYILGIRLKVADEDIGILWLQPGQANDRLLTGICAQIAIAICNTLAHREIKRQAEEIRIYKKRLENEQRHPEEILESDDNHYEIVGAGPAMESVLLSIRQVAFSNSSVMILGETGTGKELIAKAIHLGSHRRDQQMIKVNCAALPPNLIESELFGHERGSFTGAFDRKIGKFELANNSTLFLDEIGELPFDLQVKLLRAIQEKEIERVGGKKTIKVNVRIVAATNRDLQKEVDGGRFRGDLYYRLNVFPIFVPPLRDRLEDIPLLVTHFIQKLAKKTGRQAMTVSAKALDDLMRYNWPGNIRELENWIERSLLLSAGPVIQQVAVPGSGDLLSRIIDQDKIFKTLDENERGYIIEILRKCNWRVGGNGGAADILDVNTSTLHSRMRKLGIKKIRSFRRVEHE